MKKNEKRGVIISIIVIIMGLIAFVLIMKIKSLNDDSFPSFVAGV